MINLSAVDKVYLACGTTDMRKSIDGLSTMVVSCFSLDPFSSSLFVFCNHSRNKLKILHWQHNGFWLYYRRLEKGRFRWPEKSDGKTEVIGLRELGWLLDGLEISQKQAHKKVSATIVI
mgnify:CR=1 FL=1